jgi:hypothetical protein
MPMVGVIALSWSWADNPLALVSYVVGILVAIAGCVGWLWARMNQSKLVADVEAIMCPRNPNHVLALKSLKDLTGPEVRGKLREILRAQPSSKDKQPRLESGHSSEDTPASFESLYSSLRALDSNEVADQIISFLEGRIPDRVKASIGQDDDWYNAVVSVTVRSRSHTVCHDIRLRIDGAGLFAVRREGQGTEVHGANGVLNLGDLQYGESVDVTAWVDVERAPWSDWVKVTSNEGPAKIRVARSLLTGALKRRLAYPLYIVLLGVLLVLCTFLALLVETNLRLSH